MMILTARTVRYYLKAVGNQIAKARQAFAVGTVGVLLFVAMAVAVGSATSTVAFALCYAAGVGNETASVLLLSSAALWLPLSAWSAFRMAVSLED